MRREGTQGLVACNEQLSKDEGQDDQDGHEKARQRSDRFQVFPDGSVIGVEIIVTYSGDFCRASVDLSFAFSCHL